MIWDVEVRSAGDKGLGVFARRDFAEGELIFRRRHARVLTARQEIDRLADEESMHMCQLGPGRFAIVLPPGCYMNHACDPNAMRDGVKVFAWQGIKAGEEITLDYRLNAFDGTSWPCRCGTWSCTGVVVGSFFALDPDRQRAYLLHIPAFIRKEYRRRQRGRAAATGAE